MQGCPLLSICWLLQLLELRVAAELEQRQPRPPRPPYKPHLVKRAVSAGVHGRSREEFPSSTSRCYGFGSG
ncbi:hypothetical protein NDU88_011518 [Pleurodeles waltl]|uniref:Secreted protein n=1 Tax=Pleurodeles waltl TaxID=8319 RepID=A0AAV7S546_PLEWA|nr:hypothetical protein NDU88_011497 [Pleurodeles waltl]KAJ1158845.1 hypothetical protein NDU88_011518 [Pleurodeles waltl]